MTNDCHAMVMAMTENGDQCIQINSLGICTFFVYETAHWRLQLISHLWPHTSLTQYLLIGEQQQLFAWMTFMWTETFPLNTWLLTTPFHVLQHEMQGSLSWVLTRCAVGDGPSDSCLKRTRDFQVFIQTGLDSDSSIACDRPRQVLRWWDSF